MNDQPSSDDDLPGLFMALGYVAQNWALVEQNLDMWIAQIYHRLAGRTVIDKRIPRNFTRKADFLRLAFTRIGHLQPFAAEALALVDEASALACTRNDLMHGVQSGARKADGSWHMVIFDYEQDADRTHWHHARDFYFGPAEFTAYEERLVKTGHAGDAVRAAP
jgi:hypothetical protein